MTENANITKAKGLIAELSKHCISSIPNKGHSNLSKLPFKVMTFVNAMNWRMKECAEAAVNLLESDYTHPALMLIRGVMENSAITLKLADVVDTVVKRKAVERTDDDELMRILFGNNYRKDDPFTEPDDERLKADRIGKHIKRADEVYPGFQRYYSYLCEFVHPNSDGVGQSYSCLHIDEGYTEFGPQLNPSHKLYDAFTITLVLSLTIYIEQIENIESLLEEFIHICDIDIVKKYQQLKRTIMFTTNETIKGVHGIPQNQIELLRAYLQGAVYCWCNSNQKHDVFYARDFLGGENFFWEDTPAEALYRHYMEISDDDHDYAFSEAANAAGRLLKSVLYDDKRIFEVQEGYVKGYRWTGRYRDGSQ